MYADIFGSWWCLFDDVSIACGLLFTVKGNTIKQLGVQQDINACIIQQLYKLYTYILGGMFFSLENLQKCFQVRTLVVCLNVFSLYSRTSSEVITTKLIVDPFSKTAAAWFLTWQEKRMLTIFRGMMKVLECHWLAVRHQVR